ncbi:MAG: rRNA pseudouridine synthase [Candidatus Kapabacteria bacterium]|nr:rRNA pseudouridine synthase [Candidatus Kapabacteria bacterium]MDW8011633.1 pseudouridine synthase [Bacteroidota bacterium]
MAEQRRETLSQSQGVRINKFLADAGITSRRKADELIRQGRVKVNGRPAVIGMRVFPWDEVTVDGNQVRSQRRLVYLLLHKPKDYLCTLHDEKGRKTVVQLVRTKERVYPVGRLERNTTGALLLTNDGELANRLLHPRYRVPRVYTVTLDRAVRKADLQRLLEGVKLRAGTLKATAVEQEPGDRRRVYVEVCGRDRLLHRAFAKLGYRVVKLHRRSLAFLTCQGLARGQARHLTPQEVAALRRLVGLEA